MLSHCLLHAAGRRPHQVPLPQCKLWCNFCSISLYSSASLFFFFFVPVANIARGHLKSWNNWHLIIRTAFISSDLKITLCHLVVILLTKVCIEIFLNSFFFCLIFWQKGCGGKITLQKHTWQRNINKFKAIFRVKCLLIWKLVPVHLQEWGLHVCIELLRSEFSPKKRMRDSSSQLCCG